ncbi:TetR/AcrR family transcriptional regulator, partial [Ethanoligenens sp.]|uniref:TetR/AcrR family transcriptional regulator n=1 Tax=Ethanoligenens sp. TaxID=2099655 RepID=UPI0039EA07F1
MPKRSQKPVRVPRQKRSIEKKEEIVSAAYAVFKKKGYFATYTDDIAAEAGFSVASVY